jgi:hypothetical protein
MNKVLYHNFKDNIREMNLANNMNIHIKATNKNVRVYVNDIENNFVKPNCKIPCMMVNPYKVFQDNRLTLMGKAVVNNITEKFENTFEKSKIPFLHIILE